MVSGDMARQLAAIKDHRLYSQEVWDVDLSGISKKEGWKIIIGRKRMFRSRGNLEMYCRVSMMC